MAKWELLPVFLLRAAGFPISLLSAFHFNKTHKLLFDLREQDRFCSGLSSRIWHHIHELVGDERDDRRRHFLLRIRREVFKGRIHALALLLESLREPESGLEVAGTLLSLLQEWLAACARKEALEAEGQAVLEVELHEKRQALVDMARREDFQEALFLSNPNLFPDRLRAFMASWDPKNRSSKSKSIEHKLLMYLQRFCTKNETASFYGPIAFGTCQPSSCKNIDIAFQPALEGSRRPGISHREVFFAHWGVSRIAAVMSQDPYVWPHLCPRLNPSATLSAGSSAESRAIVTFHMLGRTFSLDGLDAEILAKCDGDHPVDEIVLAFPDHRRERVFHRLHELSEKYILVTKLEIPSDTYHPLEHLILEARRIPDSCPSKTHWLTRLEAYDAIRAEFRSAGLDRRPELLQELEVAFFLLLNGTTGARSSSPLLDPRTLTPSADSLAPGDPAAPLPPRSVPREQVMELARRAAGEHYGDRLLIYEECLRNVREFKLGGEILREIEEGLQPILEWDAYRGLLDNQYRKALAVDLISEELRDSQPSQDRAGEGIDGSNRVGPPIMPYGRFVRCWLDREKQGRLSGDATLGNPARNALDQRLLENLKGAGETGPIDISPFIEDIPRGELDGAVLFAAVDVLISSPDLAALNNGQYELVIGEIQPIIGTWGYSAFFVSDKEELKREVTEKLKRSGSWDRLASIVISHESKIKGYELPGTSIEFLAKSSKPRAEVISCGDLAVTVDQGVPQLQSIATGKKYSLYGGISKSFEELSLSEPRVDHAPIRMGRHAQRLATKGVVCQRERWEFSAKELLGELDTRSPFRLMLSAAKLQEAHRFPDCVFVKIPEEIKPIAIDFRSYFFIEIFSEIVRRGNGEVIITEMYPDQNGLWLQDEEGRYTSELRMTFFRTEQAITS